MEVYGLIGSPIEHSLSPRMFEAAFSARGVDATYAAFEVDAETCLSALDGAQALNIAGLNVTIPHKETVLEWASPTAVASTIGAANLIDLDSDPPRADNTDVHAMVTVLEDLALPPDEALVLGAGGAAKAYVHALVEGGWHVVVANRTIERANALAQAYEPVEAIALADAHDRVDSVDIIINATSVGMGTDETPLATSAINSDHVVIDAVYQPVQTTLLRSAEAAGAQTVTGLTLLLEQAVATYEQWRSEPAPRQAMAGALETAIAKSTTDLTD